MTAPSSLCCPCSAINTGYDTDKSFFITTKHRALDGQCRPLATGLTRDSQGQEESVVTLVLVVKPRGVIEACYLDVSEGQAGGEEPLDLFSDIKNVEPHPDPSAWDSSRAYPFPLGGNSPRLCSQVCVTPLRVLVEMCTASRVGWLRGDGWTIGILYSWFGDYRLFENLAWMVDNLKPLLEARCVRRGYLELDGYVGDQS